MYNEYGEINEIKILLKNNILKIILLFIFIIIIIIILLYFNIIESKEEGEIRSNVKDALNFKGFKSLYDYNSIEQLNYPTTIDKSKNNHFIIYGASGSGKTYFIKQYLSQVNKEDIIVFCKDLNEWDKNYTIYTEADLPLLGNIEMFKDKTIVLDDMGGNIYTKNVAEIFTKGRHYHIQIIVLAHKPADVDNKVRMNINTIYITTQNSNPFFIDIYQKYATKADLSRYVYIEHGIIKYNLIQNEFVVYDKNLHIIIDSKNNTVNTLPSFNIRKYINVRSFTENDKRQIILFLEEQSDHTINITDETFIYYLCFYLIQVEGIKPNINKYKTLVSDQKKYSLKDLTTDITNIMKDTQAIRKELQFRDCDSKAGCTPEVILTSLQAFA